MHYGFYGLFAKPQETDYITYPIPMTYTAVAQKVSRVEVIGYHRHRQSESPPSIFGIGSAASNPTGRSALTDTEVADIRIRQLGMRVGVRAHMPIVRGRLPHLCTTDTNPQIHAESVQGAFTIKPGGLPPMFSRSCLTPSANQATCERGHRLPNNLRHRNEPDYQDLTHQHCYVLPRLVSV